MGIHFIGMYSVRDKIVFLQQAFGTCVLANDGINVAVCCPNQQCGSYGNLSKKKLVIKADNDQYHCWVCDIKGGNLRGLLRKHAPRHLAEYLEKFSRHSKTRHIELADDELVHIELPSQFVLLATNLKNKDPDVQQAIQYARSRGLNERDFWYFKLGTCQSGRHRRRVIMPSFNSDGLLNYFVSRNIDTDLGMKYINAKVPKKQVIFNEINIDWKQELTLVEGPFDLTKCNDNAACLLGSTLGEDYALFHEIVKQQTPVLLAMDPDAIKKAHNIAKRLTEYGITVRMLGLGKFSDVGEMSHLEFETARQHAAEWCTDDRLHNLINSIRSGSLI